MSQNSNETLKDKAVLRDTKSSTTIIANKRNSIDFKELWSYRELMLFFAWRDIKVRYKQTILGASWAILQPLLAAVIFTVFFNRVAKISSGYDAIPYPLFAYLGLMYWNSFAGALSAISNSVVGNQGVLNKVYFPRLIPPLSAATLSVVDFAFAAVVFFFLSFFYRVIPGWQGVLLMIPCLVLIIIAALGVGIYFAALNVKYRDVRSALPFLIQIGFFVTPVIYPVSLIPKQYQIYTYLNPAAGAINTVKAGLFHGQYNWVGFLISWVTALLSVALGLWYFKRTEKNFADII